MDTDKTFRIIKKKNTAGKRYYQVRFFSGNGKLIKSKSFPPRMLKPEVEKEAGSLLPRIIGHCDESDALLYCTQFWSVDSEYFKIKVRSESYRRMGAAMIKHASDFLVNRKTGKISVLELEAFESRLVGGGMTPRTARGVIEAISRPINYYRKTLDLPKLNSIEHAQANPRIRGVFTLEEIRSVVQYRGDLRARLIFLLGALAGLRKGEIRALTLEAVNFQERYISVHANFVYKCEGIKKTKNKQDRAVPLSDTLAKAIRDVHAVYPESAFVVPNITNLKTPSDLSTYRRAFPRVLSAIGIDEEETRARNLCVHSLRHSFVTIIQSVGITQFDAQQYAGHQSMRMTQHYTHAGSYLKHVAAADALDAVLC